MRHPISALASSWRRRWWRADQEALAAFRLLEPAIVITGASEGIGAAFARHFAARNCSLLLIARDAAKLRALASTLPPCRRAIETLPLDITAEDALNKLDDALARMHCYPDVLVNNAGVGLSGLFEGASPSSIAPLIATNVTALACWCRHVLPGQLIRGRGGIINMASLGGIAPGAGQAVYYASKAFVLSFSEALAAETAGRGVRITAVAPGSVETSFHAKMQADRALYRYVLPALSADRVASAAVFGFRCGFRTVVPGVFYSVLACAARFLPHRVVMPVISLLLRPVRI